jgi:hypothetical protein
MKKKAKTHGKNKSKHRGFKKKSPKRKRTNLDAYIDSCIKSFVEACRDQILETLQLSPNGRAFLHLHIPGFREIEVEFCLDELINNPGCQIAGGIEQCKIH